MTTLRFRKTLGSYIHHERARQEMSSRQFRQRIHLSKSMISQIENGKVMPSLESLLKITQALHLDLNHIVTNSIPKPCKRCRGRGYE